MKRAMMTGYVGTLRSGRTKPILIEAVDEEGKHHQLVAKITGRQFDKGALTRELVASRLATYFGLETPAPFLLDLPKDLAQLNLPPEVMAAVRGGYFPTFATEYLPALAAFAPQRKLHEMHLQMAAEIFTFDCLIVNRDRSEDGNVNCLTDSSRFVLIDHETALDSQLIGSSIYLEPWKPNALSPMRNTVRHIFYESLAEGYADFTPIRSRWVKLSMKDVDDVLDSVPDGWRDADRGVREIRRYLSELVNNMNDSLDMVEDVLRWSP